MSDHTRSMLLEALQNLAADAEAQERHLRQSGSWPSLDELALDLDDVARASNAWISAPQRDRVRALDRKLDEMSGERNAGLWEPQALHGPEWAEVRRLAREALATF
jgi:hypothetical protein